MIRHTLACLLVLSSALQALDLTPHFGNRDLEGVRISILRFGDGSRQAGYRPPHQWTVSGTATELSLLPPTGKESKATLFVRPVESGDAAAGKSEKGARTFLPESAAEVALLSETESPFMLGHLASHEFTFAYTLTGIRFVRSVALVNLSEKERLAVVVTARQEDFQNIHAQTIASLFSWEWETS